MQIYIRNYTNGERTLHEKVFSPDESYAIPENEKISWAEDTTVSGEIRSSNFKLSVGSGNCFLSPGQAIFFLNDLRIENL